MVSFFEYGFKSLREASPRDPTFEYRIQRLETLDTFNFAGHHSKISESKFCMIAACSLNGAACKAEISSRSLGVRMMR